MAEYRYVARTREGSRREGSIDANDEIDAASKLQNLGLIIISIEAPRSTAANDSNISPTPTGARQRKRSSRVKKEELFLFYDQMATLLDSSVDIIKSLEIIALQVESQPFFDAIVSIKNDVTAGVSLSQAMSKHAKFFNELVVSIVTIGEQSGNLPDVLRRVASSIERTEEVKRKIRGALAYPCVLIVVSVVAIVIFLMRIIPLFQRIFNDFDVELPQLTQMVIRVSDTLRENILIEIVLIAGIVLLVRNVLKVKTYRYLFDRIILKLPFLGPLLVYSIMVNFTRLLSTMLENGVDVLQALGLVCRSINNLYLQEVILAIQKKVREGSSISQQMEAYDVFPPLVVQMAGVGEETGQMSKMLMKVADFYERRVTEAVDALSSIFEPAILVVMGGIVGVLVIAMFLPIFNMSNIAG